MTSQYFELTEDPDWEFWEIEVSGNAHTVRFGGIGTRGSNKVETFANADLAQAAAAKLIESKQALGYVSAERRFARDADRHVNTGCRGPGFEPPDDIQGKTYTVVRGSEMDYPIGVYTKGHEFFLLGGTLESRPPGEEAEKFETQATPTELESWSFRSNLEARRALRALVAEYDQQGVPFVPAKKPLEELEGELIEPSKPRIAIYAAAEQGSVTFGTHGVPPWLIPRPPGQCGVCQRVMIPIFSLSGPIDDRLGEQVLVVVSQCPDQGKKPFCAVEVVVQRSNVESMVDVFLRDERNRFFSLHMSQQQVPNGLLWTMTEHFGERGTPGIQTSTRFSSFAAVGDAICLRSMELIENESFRVVPMSEFGEWYEDLLGEMHHFFRPDARDEKEAKLVRTTEPFQQSCSTWPLSCPSYWARHGSSGLTAKQPVGGVPTFYRSEWDAHHECPHCGSDMLYLFSTCENGSPYISAEGEFWYFCCPRCTPPFGWAKFEEG